MDYNNCRINGIYYWIIPKYIRMASNFLEILNTIKLNLINQAGYTQYFDVSIKVLKSKHFAFAKNIDYPSICNSDCPECECILIHL